jgi:hypothetical protein
MTPKAGTKSFELLAADFAERRYYALDYHYYSSDFVVDWLFREGRRFDPRIVGCCRLCRFAHSTADRTSPLVAELIGASRHRLENRKIS